MNQQFWRFSSQIFVLTCLFITVVFAFGQEPANNNIAESSQRTLAPNPRYQNPPPPPPRVENLKSTRRASSGFGSVPQTMESSAPSQIPPKQLILPGRPLPPISPERDAPSSASQPSSQRETATQPTAPVETDLVDVKLEVSGKIGDQKIGLSNLRLEANLAYEEQILQSGDGVSTPIQAIRLFNNAEATIWLGDSRLHPKLREDRRYIGVFCTDAKMELFSPDGSLTREELDLLDILANSAVINLLLPQSPLRQYSQWSLSDQVLRCLLGLDFVLENTVNCRVTEIFPGGIARAEMSGKFRGSVLGAITQGELIGRFQFALAKRKVTWLGLIMRENRGGSFVDYPFELTSRLQLTRTAVTDSKLANHVPSASITFPPLPEQLRLVYRDESTGWQLTYDRKWYVVRNSPELVVFRMVDRQGQVAQCNIAPLQAEKAKITLTGLRDNVQQILGENFGRILDANELRSPTGHQMFHVHAVGQVSEVPIHWIYYVLTTPQGKCYATAFTVEEKTLERFGNSDREFVDGFEFLQPAEEAKISQSPKSNVR
ncbi:MAG: hypothetical protein ACUVQG_06135 [Thermogutta sp.]